MPYGITQCYLPPGRGDIPALTPSEAGTRLLCSPTWGGVKTQRNSILANACKAGSFETLYREEAKIAAVR